MDVGVGITHGEVSDFALSAGRGSSPWLRWRQPYERTAAPQAPPVAPPEAGLRIRLLGGFRVERADAPGAGTAWQRRSAKTLIKLLAVTPGHALHREQILEVLWPGVDLDSGLNSFGKALHAARRALEPELQPRGASAYLCLSDAVLALNPDQVAIDADRFQRLAEAALQRGDIAAHESALAAYAGELLPEDRYEDWCAQRRSFLAELRVRLLLGLADVLERHGAYREAADHLREVVEDDPIREDVHRRLIRIHAQMGNREQAGRQFDLCREALARELGRAPQNQTVVLHQQVQADQLAEGSPIPGPAQAGRRERLPTAQTRRKPFVGRELLLQRLHAHLTRADQGRGRLILVSGETGVGKSRLVAEFATQAQQHGAAVLWGGSGAHSGHVGRGSFAVALERYAASRPASEREALAQRYPQLGEFVPSLGTSAPPAPSPEAPGDDPLHLLPAIVRLLTDLARTHPVCLVLGDLGENHPASLEMLQYLAHLAVQRRWLLIGTLREEELEPGSGLQRMVDATARERLCVQLEVPRLPRCDHDELVRGLLPGADLSEDVLDPVFARSLGNPLFTEELVLEMRARGELTSTGGAWRATPPGDHPRVPRRVRALVAMRLSVTSQSVRRVLALAAASAGEISLTDLRAAAAALQPSISDAALFDALDCALQGRILEERPDGYAFRHPLFGEALYEELAKHRRDQLHAALERCAARTTHRLRLAASPPVSAGPSATASSDAG